MRAVIQVSIATLLLAGASACKHDLTALQVDLDEDVPDLLKDGGSSGASGAGGGGSSGGGGTHDGTGGSDLPHPMTDCECDDPSAAAKDMGLMTCCYGLRNDKCGLNFGLDRACLPPAAPGMEDAECPASRKDSMPLAGCCRPDARCGFQTGALGLGCVARDDIPATLVGAALTPMACEYSCEVDDDCSVAGSEYKCAEHPQDAKKRICVQTCQRDADCPRDQVCALTNDVGMNRVLAFCQQQLTTKGPGEECSSADECAQGVCLINAQVCTQLCKFKSDCPVDRPNCVQAPIDRPNHMGTPIEFGACLPNN